MSASLQPDTRDAVEDLLGQMTLAEKCTMLAGKGFWTIPGCARLGIPDWTVSDGPVGVRGRRTGPGLLVPGPSALAATWDAEMVNAIGVALGKECLDKHVDMLLAPTVNMHRAPRNGRHFEAFSEDPELAARMAVAYIEGVQSTGVGACVKHYVANDQETNRRTVNVKVDMRTLREIYLPPFEAAVNEAGVRAVMGAYNYVNGHHACAHPELILGLLKGEWGFSGFVVSDWGATKGTREPARYGLDLEMPLGGHWDRGQLQAAVESGEVEEKRIDDKVRRLLEFLAWRGRLEGESDETESPMERNEHRALVRRTAAASMVLIRNERRLLPLDPSKRIAIIGPLAAETSLLGGGSASLEPYRRTNLLDAMSYRLDQRLVTHAPGIRLRKRVRTIPTEWLGETKVTVELFAGETCEGEPFLCKQLDQATFRWRPERRQQDRDSVSARLSMTATLPQSGRYLLMASGSGHARLFVDGALAADNSVAPFAASFAQRATVTERDLKAGRPYQIVLEQTPGGHSPAVMMDVGCELWPGSREDLLRQAEEVGAEADIAVVVVGSSDEWETEGRDRDRLELPNGQDELVGRVLDANPNTVVVLNCGAPVTLPWLDDVPATLLAWYPGQEGGEAIADVLLGEADPGGRMPTTWARREQDTPAYLNFPGEADTVRYGEGIYIGYRWYDARGIRPLVPFGHGGSYATFAWGEPRTTGSGPDLVVEVPVTNTSNRTGSDVVQVYVASHCSPVHRPEKELAGFAKVHLGPGETSVACIALSERSFARWDLETGNWKSDAGAYDILIAASASDVRARLPMTVG